MQLLLGTVPVAAVLGVNGVGKFGVVHFSKVNVKQPLPALPLGTIFLCTMCCQSVSKCEAIADRGNYNNANV